MIITALLRVTILGSAIVVLGATAGTAALRCDGPYQVLSSGETIATPYCEDTYLGAVARSRGIAVSGATIRANFNAKRRVCARIGGDIRVADICAQFRRGRRPIWLVP